ncbi:aspartate/glutamate racemase family protein [Desulfospira joergensenii]|uniref:aspartate/glutamate racemase family protein n=1 Tax=Desulfospira joergensenii TaxID=53329 RepID=UPI0003B5B15C|nr:aspartate/glutamate racemase family protein [Desulfospira joergensenii]
MAEPFMGIIMLDTVFPRIQGDIGNPSSFDFPVRYKIVKGASPEKIVLQADPGFIQPMIQTGRDLIREGACALATSCGFLALFHKELSKALSVPMLTSSLLQVTKVFQTLEPGQAVGIITAREQSLTRAHLSGAGIQDIPLVIRGMDESEEFTRVFIRGGTTLDRDLCRTEMKMVARNLVESHPEVGAIVLECTNMPPYTDAVRRATGLPVYDILTLLNDFWYTEKA